MLSSLSAFWRICFELLFSRKIWMRNSSPFIFSYRSINNIDQNFLLNFFSDFSFFSPESWFAVTKWLLWAIYFSHFPMAVDGSKNDYNSLNFLFLKIEEQNQISKAPHSLSPMGLYKNTGKQTSQTNHIHHTLARAGGQEITIIPFTQERWQDTGRTLLVELGSQEPLMGHLCGQ